VEIVAPATVTATAKQTMAATVKATAETAAAATTMVAAVTMAVAAVTMAAVAVETVLLQVHPIRRRNENKHTWHCWSFASRIAERNPMALTRNKSCTLNEGSSYRKTRRRPNRQRDYRQRHCRLSLEPLESRLLLAAVSAANLRLTEINYNPAAPSAVELAVNPNLDNDQFEFLEFQNISNETIELSGARITAGISFDFQNANPISIGAGEYFVLARDIAAYQIRYGNSATVIGQFASGGLGNGGEQIAMLDAQLLPVFDLTYDDQGDWPNWTDGHGATLELVPGSSNYNSPDSWRNSSDFLGSPGIAGTTPLHDIVINEILSHTGDQVWLMEPDGAGSFIRFVDQVDFGAQLNGESWGRWSDSSGPLYPMTSSSLGEPNTGPRIGPLVISEVMYNPSPPTSPGVTVDELEFIEIHNPLHTGDNLSNWRLRGGIDYDFPTGQVLAGNQSLVVLSFAPFDSLNVARVSGFRDQYDVDESVTLLGPYTGRLSNSAEEVRLTRPDEPPREEPNYYPQLLEDAINYRDSSPWPELADGQGPSLSRRFPVEWGHAPTSWYAGVPSPGEITQSFSVTSFAFNVLSDPADIPKGPQPSSWAEQRSDIRNAIVTFSDPVDPTFNDFRLVNLGVDAPAEPDQVVPLTANHLSVDGDTVTLNFNPNELADGAYSLEILSTLSSLNGAVLDGNDDGAAGDSFLFQANAQNSFYKLLTDTNGDGGVSVFDFSTFSYWFGVATPDAPSYVDFNQDGGVSVFDFTSFSSRFGTGIVYPTAFVPIATISIATVSRART